MWLQTRPTVLIASMTALPPVFLFNSSYAKFLSNHKRTPSHTLSPSHLNNLGNSRAASTWVFWRWPESTTHTHTGRFFGCAAATSWLSSWISSAEDGHADGMARHLRPQCFCSGWNALGPPTRRHAYTQTHAHTHTGWPPESLE